MLKFCRMRNRRVREGPGQGGQPKQKTPITPTAIQSGARRIHQRRETNGRMQILRLDGAFRPPRIAVDDDFLVEVVIGFQARSERPTQIQQHAEDDEAGKAEEAQQQHRRQADNEDRQQRQYQK